MAWFFQHESCAKKRSEHLERIAGLETDVAALRRSLADLDERFATYQGREKKRAARAAPPREEEDELPVAQPAQPGPRIVPTSSQLSHRFRVGG